jgi:glyoxylase I family protein
MFKRIDHIEIVSTNPEKTLNFYTEILGFKIQWRFKPEGASQAEIVFLELGGTLIEMFLGRNASPASTEQRQAGYRRIGLEVEDMDKTIEYLKAKGVEISSGPRATRENLKLAEIKDPDGLPIELIQRG